MFAKVSQDRQFSNALLQGVFQSFADGILVLAEQGEWVYFNDVARQICAQLAPEKPSPDLVPEAIWKVCRTSIRSHKSYVGQPTVIECEVSTNNLANLRVRVQWLRLDGTHSPYLLIILEDREQLIRNLAIAEANTYGLTRREREFWSFRVQTIPIRRSRLNYISPLTRSRGI